MSVPSSRVSVSSVEVNNPFSKIDVSSAEKAEQHPCHEQIELMSVVAPDPVGIGFQDRIIELGEPPGRLDVRWVFGDAFIALDPRKRQKEIESVVQLVKSNIDCLVGLDVPAIDVLAICREEQTRLVALYQGIGCHDIDCRCGLALVSDTEEQLVLPQNITRTLRQIVAALLQFGDRRLWRVIEF